MHQGSYGEESSPRQSRAGHASWVQVGQRDPEDGKQPGQESHHSIPSVHRHSYCKPASTLMNVSILPLKSL